MLVYFIVVSRYLSILFFLFRTVFNLVLIKSLYMSYVTVFVFFLFVCLNSFLFLHLTFIFHTNVYIGRYKSSYLAITPFSFMSINNTFA